MRHFTQQRSRVWGSHPGAVAASRAPSLHCLREKLDIFSLRHLRSPAAKEQDPGCHQQDEPPRRSSEALLRSLWAEEGEDSRCCPQVCSGPAGAWAGSHQSDLLLCSWRKQTRPKDELPEMGEEPAEGGSEEPSAVTW